MTDPRSLADEIDLEAHPEIAVDGNRITIGNTWDGVTPKQAAAADAGGDELSDLKVDDLKALAAAEGVDLDGAKTKAQIVEAIEAHRAAVDTPET